MANAAAFGWGLEKLQPKSLFFLDAKQEPDQVQAGGFDLSGLLAVVQSQAHKMRAKRIVFDSIDVLLRLLNDPVAERRELYRLHEWLLAQGLPAILTRAVANVTARCCEQLNEKHRTEAPDAAREPQRALKDGGLLTGAKNPANSSRVSPLPRSPPAADFVTEGSKRPRPTHHQGGCGGKGEGGEDLGACA
jgi:hypothetical protein